MEVLRYRLDNLKGTMQDIPQLDSWWVTVSWNQGYDRAGGRLLKSEYPTSDSVKKWATDLVKGYGTPNLF